MTRIGLQRHSNKKKVLYLREGDTGRRDILNTCTSIFCILIATLNSAIISQQVCQ